MLVVWFSPLQLDYTREIDSIVLCEGKKRNGFVRFLMSDEDMTEIQEIFDKVGRLIAIFVVSLNHQLAMLRF